MAPILINKDVFEPDNDLKLTIWNCKITFASI